MATFLSFFVKSFNQVVIYFARADNKSLYRISGDIFVINKWKVFLYNGGLALLINSNKRKYLSWLKKDLPCFVMSPSRVEVRHGMFRDFMIL